MHLGVVHDPGFSPGLIYLFPHGGKNGAFIRFKNAPAGSDDRLERFDVIKVLPTGRDIEYDEITTLFPVSDFESRGNLGSMAPGSDDEVDQGIDDYKSVLTSDEIADLPAGWPVALNPIN